MDKHWNDISSLKSTAIKHITSHYFYIIFTILSSVMGCLIILLYVEYRFFYQQSRKMVQLQHQYYHYINEVKKLFCTQSDIQGCDRSSACNTDGEGSFTPVNRAMSYLKESAAHYLKEQRIRSSIDQIYEVPCISSNEPVIKQTKKSKRTFRSRKMERSFSVPLSEQKTDFLWPIDRMNFWVSSYYGPRKKSFHYGLDMAAVRGTPVRPAGKGKVEQAGYVSGYGNMVTVVHNEKYKTRYAHLDQIYVNPGKLVSPSDIIGSVGDTGFTIKTGTDASHLHFEVCEYGKQINPLHVLPRT